MDRIELSPKGERGFGTRCGRPGDVETARQLRPRLLLLDPLVRLHGFDENDAGEVAELLAYFRSLQRELDLSVILVHHTRKNAAEGIAADLG